ncbi:Glycerophosphoryl diester phosphodiesterase [Gracilaria domingensis]|nr:Glycerophosphoryl diester phosphodiesterase [Gracilaria domingensis]
MTASFWPSVSAGPFYPTLPLCHPLLRIIPGSPREAKPVLQWITQPSSSSPPQLHATSRTASAVIEVPDTASTEHWLDFAFDISDATEYIAFKVTAGAHECSATVLSQEFSGGQRALSRALVDARNVPLAILNFDFRYVTPFSVPQPAISKKPFVPRFTGHRGMGSSGPHVPWRPLENSVESFLMATLRNQNVRTIELDVQLTRDNKVVLYHNWFFRPCDRSGHPVYDRESVKIPVHSLTFDQFNRLYQQSYASNAPLSQQQRETRRMARELAIPDSCFDVQIRTLSEVCRLLPTDIGILLEIKYPAPNVQDDLDLPYPEMNHYVDLVLNDLMSSGAAHPESARRVAFLSFNADICTMLSMKQNQFPVYFSHCEVLDKPCDEFDPRSVYLQEGYRFVKSHNLDGLMLLNRLVELRPDVIKQITADDIPILTYGKSNSDAEVVRKQLETGVKGIIADDVNILMKEMGT